jgi:methionyl-tRNA formyltransferase
LKISAADTADTLYRKIKKLELEVFQEAWPDLESSRVCRVPQNVNAGSCHTRRDLFQEQIQKINLDETTTPREFITKLMALTTNRIEEAAYFEINGSRYRIQVAISSEQPEMIITRAVHVESVPASVTAVDVPFKLSP